MPEYADIYALARERTEAAIVGFLDRFLPARIESADEYEMPQYSPSPEIMYTSALELIRHCCKSRGAVHSVYWRSDAQPDHAMVFFLGDGGLILGISTPASESQRVDQIVSDLECHFATEEVIVSYENLPPESTADFRALLDSLPLNPDETARRLRTHRPIKG